MNTMKTYTEKLRYGILTLLLATLFAPCALIAQPSPDQLADRINDLHQQRLSIIQSLQMTVKTEVAGFSSESVTRYIRTETDGRFALVPDESYDDLDTELFEGMYDGSFDRVIRAAESVTEEQLDSRASYRLIIRDSELLQSLGEEDEYDEDGMTFEIEKATLWIDSDLLMPLKMVYEQYEDGGGLTVEMELGDYKLYSGLPVAHTMAMKIEGMDQMMSDEDLAEARQAMREFEEQLESMPEAQRKMIREQMSGQMEQFERILESGMASTTIMEVVDVKVNQ